MGFPRRLSLRADSGGQGIKQSSQSESLPRLTAFPKDVVLIVSIQIGEGPLLAELSRWPGNRSTGRLTPGSRQSPDFR